MGELVEKFIKHHSDGVTMSEMMSVLLISRLRLGYAIKKLLNEGKICKIDKRYYPNWPADH